MFTVLVYIWVKLFIGYFPKSEKLKNIYLKDDHRESYGVRRKETLSMSPKEPFLVILDILSITVHWVQEN